MPMHELMCGKGLMSFDIKWSIVILFWLPVTWPRWRTSDQRVGGASVGYCSLYSAVDLPSCEFCHRSSRVSFHCFPFSNWRTRFHHSRSQPLSLRTDFNVPRTNWSVPESAGNSWRGAYQQWVNFVCDPVVYYARSSLSGSRMGAVE